jgi:predicted GIY-YIG superfamily endonuclease
MIFLAQDFMAEFCMEDARGFYTEESKRWVVRLNHAMRQWVALLGKISTHKRLMQIEKIQRDAGVTTSVLKAPVVYARVNLENEDMYIGETKDFDNRVKQHHVQTCKHRHDATVKCKGCREHVKYLKHRSTRANAWITVPVQKANEKYEAKRAERKLIRMLKPSLNAVDKPFWLLKSQYVAVYKSTRRSKKGAKPWKRDSVVGSEKAAMPFFTQYEYHNGLYLDFGAVLAKLATSNKAGTVTVVPGKHDVTRWARVRDRYGGSKIRTYGIDSFDGILHDWKKKSGDKATLHVRAFVEDKIDGTVWTDVKELANGLQKADDEALRFFWNIRKDKTIFPRIKAATMILDECEARYEGFTRKAIELRLPFFNKLDAWKMKRLLNDALDKQTWPKHLIDWHKTNMKIISESQPSIEEILCNVTKPWMPHGACKCQEIKKRLREKCPNIVLPEIESHLFFTSRDYQGPNEGALKVGGNNIPSQTMWDLTKAWDKLGKQLPACLGFDSKTWGKELKGCLNAKRVSARRFTSTREVYTLRKDLSGLVCGQTDKNLHELWFCCPCLYEKAWGKMYGEQAGYEKIYPRKHADADGNVMQTDEPAPRSLGTQKDLVKAWGAMYKRKQWHRFATLDKKGGFNRPYILFKNKKILDHAIRKKEWAKARPIAPQTKHPMKRLFHLAGRAWSFIANNLTSDNFVIQHGGQVIQFLKDAERKLQHLGQLRCDIKDIDGCFPNMPKEVIRLALRSELKKITEATGHDSVTVPLRKTQQCTLKPSEAKGMKVIPFEDLLDIMDFALDNTIVKDFDGQLWRQVQGIPMGDPHSPGMTIISCAWMEHEWLQTVHTATKERFVAKRYMDDVICFTAQGGAFDDERFRKDLSEECYLPPLKLVDGGEGTFLETRFEITADNRIRHWLKNDNLADQPAKVTRYAHYDSHADFAQKRAVLMACLLKVDKMASDDAALVSSAAQKLAEFTRLCYPRKMLWTACTTMGVKTRHRAWFQVRDTRIPPAA